jgi:hypothetical protein
MCYQPWNQKKSQKYSLRVESHPNHLERFSQLLSALQGHTKAIFFVKSDVAFDIPLPSPNVFVASKTGRKMSIYEGTRYFGRSNQRQLHGYCRVYDKKLQLEDSGATIEGERTRVEIVYRPSEKVPMDRLIQCPPRFNSLYSCNVITEMDAIKPEKRAIILALQHGLMTFGDFSKYQKKNIKELLSVKQQVNFDVLVNKDWENLVALSSALTCGVVSHLPIREVHAGPLLKSCI